MISIPSNIQAALARDREKLERRSNPYKTEHFGRWAANIIQQLHNTKAPVRIRPHGGSITTTRLKFYQGLAWAKEHIDGIAQFADFTVCRTYHDYLEVHIRMHQRSSPELPEVTVAADWRNEFELFLDTAKKGDKIDHHDVTLTQEDMNYILSQLLPLEGMMAWKVEEHRLFVCRLE